MRATVALPENHRVLGAAPSPRAIVFDWDNTLIDSWDAIGAAFNETLGFFGKPAWSPETVRRRVQHSLRDSFPQLFGADWMRARDQYYRSFGATHLKGLKPLPGAERLLKRLFDAGIYLAVVSNKTGHYLRREAAHLGWEGYFGAIIGAGDAARDKPAPDPLLMALQPLGISPDSSVWVVGDAEVDMKMARAGGCTAVLAHVAVPVGHDPGLDAGFDAWIADCDALFSLLGEEFLASTAAAGDERE